MILHLGEIGFRKGKKQKKRKTCRDIILHERKLDFAKAGDRQKHDSYIRENHIWPKQKTKTYAGVNWQINMHSICGFGLLALSYMFGFLFWQNIIFSIVKSCFIYIKIQQYYRPPLNIVCCGWLTHGGLTWIMRRESTYWCWVPMCHVARAPPSFSFVPRFTHFPLSYVPNSFQTFFKHFPYVSKCFRYRSPNCQLFLKLLSTS